MNNTYASIDIDFLFEYLRRKIPYLRTTTFFKKIILIIIVIVVIIIVIIVIIILIIYMKKLLSFDRLRLMHFSGNSMQKRVNSVQRNKKPDFLIG